MGLKLVKMKTQDQVEGIIFDLDEETISNFIAKLPFKLTDAQMRVLNEILPYAKERLRTDLSRRC